MNFTDVQITTVNNVFEPIDNKSVKLLSSSSASLFFEWEAALTEDGGAAQYEIAFDKIGGDFSKPLYKVISTNKGFASNAYVSHKILNTVASLAGINPGETGDIQWTVISSRGIIRKTSAVVRKLKITSLQGFSEIPSELFITGEGSETGNSVNLALPFKSVANGEYEIYTKLEAGKSYKFIDKKEENARSFYSEDQVKLKESDNMPDMKVAKTGVYRIEIDFNVANIKYTEIKSVGLWFSPEGKVLFDLPYAGKGIWSATQVINFKQESWGKDERYKFQLSISSNGQDEVAQLGTKNPTDSRPNASSPESYYHIKMVPVDRWNDKWKFALEVDGKSTEIRVILQGDKEYTHQVTVK
ncbi:SusE domain-containing protein [Sphingobacterium sp. HJSM2_6]|uniref:SusE domain-containing protein n=1 Tax=Sphingobacterium sp. HJSM2_6 TaxID=3366264 RepID=UPI003BD06124